MEETWTQDLQEKTQKHPCYCDSGHQYARMHIPVAPKCNIQCNYCNRKYDCQNESRPGVTSEVLNPEQALEKYKLVKERLDNLMVVGIAGPGDALANFIETKRSIELIRSYDPNVTFCLSTNGLMLPDYVDDIVKLGVTHITVTINAIDPKIGAKIYSVISYKGGIYSGEEGAALLIQRQFEGLEKLKDKNVVIKVNTVMIKGINDEHIPELVKKLKEYGVYLNNIMPLIPANGSAFENMAQTSNAELNQLRRKCALDLKQMYHCRQCRADAIGILGEDISFDFRKAACSTYHQPVKEKKYRIAVASKTGRLVDQHFGHAEALKIYEYSEKGITLLETRQADQYCTGVEECEDTDSKIDKMLRIVSDCDALLCLRIGNSPKRQLEAKGIFISEMYEEIEAAISKIVNQLKLAS